MSLKITFLLLSLPFITASAVPPSQLPTELPTDTTSITPSTLTQDAIARQLGWVESDTNQCGGFYIEQPFEYPVNAENQDIVAITGNEGLLSQRGTSTLDGGITLTRSGQQITATKAYLYRDANGKLNAVDLVGNLHLREPNTLVLGKTGRYEFDTNSKFLMDTLYRTTLINNRQIAGSNVVPVKATLSERRITTLTAWGRAYEFSQTEPRVYRIVKGSFSTCPPNNPAWQVKASSIVLDKNSGRGYATNARILVKNVPVFYLPYVNFPIDNRRKTGFLLPKFGVSNQWGPYLQTPFYWNMAPNYDMTITPGILDKRGLQLDDNFRYLTPYNEGNLNFNIVPNDHTFADFQTSTEENPEQYYPISGNVDVTQAELNRLLNSSKTRRGFFWRDNSQFNPHWSSHVDFNYASDDYYLRDFGNLNEITQNQLLQEGDLYYKNEHWNFTGRVQSYQTLHPIDVAPVQNAYRRFPQLLLTGDYPDQAFGLQYFINSEATYFEILKNPGSNTLFPMGERFNVQPGVSLPLVSPSAYVIPRFQVPLTQYNLTQVNDTNTPSTQRRAVPIFDVLSGVMLDRDFGWDYQQTLEPQLYYTYIPYRNQEDIPVFDTTVNTLTYDQIFNYNRFSGIDRIGDTNQIAGGISSRLIDQETGLEKARVGVGEIIYFINRRVTLCNNNSCSDNPNTPANRWRLSPISGVADYHVSPTWKITGNALWNTVTKQIDNSSVGLNYATDNLHILNFDYSFVRNGNPFSGIIVNSSENNLKSTDFSFSWPIPFMKDLNAVGRWTQDWHTNHFQNLLYGVQYDTCCWAVRLVGGRSFTNIENNTPQYNNEAYLQFSLKGFSNIGTDPSKLLSNITGYNAEFGQEV